MRVHLSIATDNLGDKKIYATQEGASLLHEHTNNGK